MSRDGLLSFDGVECNVAAAVDGSGKKEKGAIKYENFVFIEQAPLRKIPGSIPQDRSWFIGTAGLTAELGEILKDLLITLYLLTPCDDPACSHPIKFVPLATTGDGSGERAVRDCTGKRQVTE